MLLGVGEGNFAVLVTIGVAVVAALLGGYFMPRFALFIAIGCIGLPFIVYGCILTSPQKASPEVYLGPSVYRERRLPTDTYLIDKFVPVRIVIFIVFVFAMLGGIAALLLGILTEPPYRVPRMRCLREQLEESHPNWYK
ncbi:hypothetical protein STCU_00367 [Strigomonas culicis]|uniref:Uncharacterized protein n=1 Tax=Strigomonas culicis TaxID=28005 RepID=S9V185_9TRYP|nr:hypothetical protein STCU_01264 [Strigomonas culicis]EPY36867.1 hypothetical protein STCU_00367 [Strigomonas culicis]|eukprot:EPY35072.1 hypothetical protein STCU_01264 [Strigomonas culicis]